MSTYWIPMYGTGSTVGLVISACAIDSSVTVAKPLEAAWYSGIAYVDVRVPGATRFQPNLVPTSFASSLLVAQLINVQAASFFLLLAGMPSDHAHSQPDQSLTLVGA